jgi:hypothetical protein
VAKKRDFWGIQQKIPQKSYFALNQDANPVPSKFDQNLQQKFLPIFAVIIRKHLIFAKC